MNDNVNARLIRDRIDELDAILKRASGRPHQPLTLLNLATQRARRDRLVASLKPRVVSEVTRVPA